VVKGIERRRHDPREGITASPWDVPALCRVAAGATGVAWHL
jgi:hypothetical protein